MGGIHPTILPIECLEYADIVCIGEGEKSIVELVNKIKLKKTYLDIPGLWFKNDKNIIKNEIRPLIQDLDSIPYPDYEIDTHYILDNNAIQKMDERLLNIYIGGIYCTLPTRGCPFGCTYCCNNTIIKMYNKQNIFRKRSIDNIINELVIIKNKFNLTKEIKFDDDSFFLYSLEEIKEFSDKYKKLINLPLTVTGVTPKTLSEEKLKYLVDAGLKRIRMGIQSGCKKTLKLYKRNYSNDEIEHAANLINKFKDKVIAQYDIILDNPWETDIDRIETIKFLSRVPLPYRLSIFSLIFYPETELYEKAKNEGILTDELCSVYQKYLHDCEKTFLNDIVFLINNYALWGARVPYFIINLLTNEKLMKYKISWILYKILCMINIPYIVHNPCHLIKEGLKDIMKSDLSRIYWFIKTRNKVKSL